MEPKFCDVARVDSMVGELPERATMLDLPTEIILSIMEYVDPATQLLTAATCRRLHEVLKPGIADKVRRMPLYEYNSHLIALLNGYKLHDRLLCMICHRLHNVEAHDIPGVTKGLTFYGCWPIGAKVANMSKYCLHQRHVQMALRYAQCDDKQPQLKKLLQSYYDSGSATFAPMFRETMASPLIGTDGHYLLHVHERFRPLYHSEITMGQCQFLELCPHTGTSPRFSSYVSHGTLRAALEQAIDRRDASFEGWCWDCATAFAVMVTESGLVVDAWYDFGSDPSPSSPYWTTHVDHSHFNPDEYGDLGGPFPGTHRLKRRYEEAREAAT